MSHLALPLRPLTHERRPGRATAWVLTTTAVLVAAVLVLDALADPGGWPGLWLASLVAVPIVVLSFLTHRDPHLGVRVIGALTGAYAVASLVLVAQRDWLEHLVRHGPVQLAVLIVLLVPTGVLAFTRPRAAGLAVVVLTLTPVLLDLVVRSGGRPLLVILAGPLLACAAVLLTRHTDHGSE